MGPPGAHGLAGPLRRGGAWRRGEGTVTGDRVAAARVAVPWGLPRPVPSCAWSADSFPSVIEGQLFGKGNQNPRKENLLSRLFWFFVYLLLN